MRLPRWTVYPALAVLILLVVTAVPHTGDEGEHTGAAARARELHGQLESNRRPAGIDEGAATRAEPSGTEPH